MSEEDGKNRGFVAEPHHHQHHEPQYGTFQGVANYPPPRPPRPPVMGFPQPVPPPGVTEAPVYAHGYQTVPGYAIAEGRPVRERRLPCCGCGLGWFLFIIGWFIAGIPWYFGALVMLCSRRVDPREKPGYVACTIAAVFTTIAIVLGATKAADEW